MELWFHKQKNPALPVLHTRVTTCGTKHPPDIYPLADTLPESGGPSPKTIMYVLRVTGKARFLVLLFLMKPLLHWSGRPASAGLASACADVKTIPWVGDNGPKNQDSNTKNLGQAPIIAERLSVSAILHNAAKGLDYNGGDGNKS